MLTLVIKVGRAVVMTCAAIATYVGPSAAQVRTDQCDDPGQFETATIAILRGADSQEIVEAFGAIEWLSETGQQAAADMYISEVGDGTPPATLTLLVNDTATCARITVI